MNQNLTRGWSGPPRGTAAQELLDDLGLPASLEREVCACASRRQEGVLGQIARQVGSVPNNAFQPADLTEGGAYGQS